MGCAEAKGAAPYDIKRPPQMQPAWDALRQSARFCRSEAWKDDATRMGCAEAKRVKIENQQEVLGM